MWRGIRPLLLIALFIYPRPTIAQIPNPRDPMDITLADGQVTWIDWWETNRDTYLRQVLQKGRLDAAETPKDIPAKVVDALLEATRSDSRNVRAEAALALARMGKGTERLLELTRDPDDRVRCRAWVCLGLLQKERELLQADKLGDAESLAVVTGLGLLDKPTDKAVERVRLIARTAKYAEAQRMAIWALRVYHNLDLVDDQKDVDNSLLLDVVQTSENPAVVSEALLAMGTVGGSEDLPQLLDVAQLGRQTSALPAFARARIEERTHGNLWFPANAMRGAACLAIAQMKDSTRRPRMGVPGANGAADPMAISARSAMLNKNARVPGPMMFYPGSSTLALARLGEVPSLGIMLRFGDMGLDSPYFSPLTPLNLRNLILNEMHFASTMDDYRKPTRAYAAIGLGLYGGGVGFFGNRDWLPFYVSATPAPQQLRAACAMAMALSHQGNGDLLAQVADKLDPNKDARFYGYIVLSLALLQDSRALQYANRYGLGAKDAIDPAEILKSDFDSRIHFEPPKLFPWIENMDRELGVRAALLGLALTGDQAAKPALLANWGSDQWITLEASRAMGWCGVYDGVDPMLVLLKQTQKKNIQAWTARCLGEMFDRNQPSTLSRLTEGNYYAYPIKFTKGKWIDLPPSSDAPSRAIREKMTEREFPGLDNPFLYWQLLPGIDGRYYTEEIVGSPPNGVLWAVPKR